MISAFANPNFQKTSHALNPAFLFRLKTERKKTASERFGGGSLKARSFRLLLSEIFCG
ncbi:hypothetical protein HMP0721_2376 [Pseudoramibacter alactolyticus ATCC 23263]|uniref:Uncharacterized protein n=1 Tax=Pseudoramibacter alactolyticus ATCC 23263 TaxID=887929 RepID=E6MK40_9FIRM|nr:hypothetical protein HMP0721_2376 [Pseudoramibacter alactolyticus ATCC 23263]